METIFWCAVAAIGWTYIGFALTLYLLTKVLPRHSDITPPEPNRNLPMLSVIIAAHNEQDHIASRIRNVFGQGYPTDRLEIIVGSDGSTDGTVNRAKAVDPARVQVLEFAMQRGRARVHNDAVQHAKGEILVFTDAQTEFAPAFLAKATGPFENKAVGCVVGAAVWRNQEDGLARDEGLFWRYEQMLRLWLSQLGLLATGSGAAMLVRRELFKPLLPSDDVDFITPLDVVTQGRRVVQLQDAIFYDDAAATPAREFRVRVRSTAKNFRGTLRRWGLLNFLQHPLVTAALLSHKVLRWLTPYFIAAGAISALELATKSKWYALLLYLGLTALAAAIVGLLFSDRSRRLPFASLASSFLVANAGIALGVAKAIFGSVPAIYKPGHN